MVINPDRLQEVAMGDQEFLRELIDLYLSDAPSQLEALGQAVATQDTTAVSAAAHKLKGSCGNVGAEGLVALCQRIEVSGKASRLEQLSELFREVEREFEEVHEALHGMMAGAQPEVKGTRQESV